MLHLAYIFLNKYLVFWQKLFQLVHSWFGFMNFNVDISRFSSKIWYKQHRYIDRYIINEHFAIFSFFTKWIYRVFKRDASVMSETGWSKILSSQIAFKIFATPRIQITSKVYIFCYIWTFDIFRLYQRDQICQLKLVISVCCKEVCELFLFLS